jgi:vancomycin permeability regulator SanA
MKHLKRIIYIFIIIGIVAATAICFDGLHDDVPVRADAAVVLGAKVYESGTLSPALQARCDRSVDLYKQKVVPIIIVSGGLGREGFWEGDKMRDYLMQQGVPESCIVVDNYGNNSRLTADNACSYFQKQTNNDLSALKIVVVSQYFHITRCRLALRQTGFRQVYGAHAYFFEWLDLYHIPREVVAMVVYWWRK